MASDVTCPMRRSGWRNRPCPLVCSRAGVERAGVGLPFLGRLTGAVERPLHLVDDVAADAGG
jgi:hypothetical protein